jgi:hypothetical protein
MLRKKLFPIVLASCIITTSVPNQVIAEKIAVETATITVDSVDTAASGEVTVTSGSKTEATSKNLEKIIKLVKGKISIPKDLSKFDYHFNTESYYSKAYWNLTWRTEDYTKRLSVQCDQDGNILNYYSYEDEYGRFTPKYLKSELRDKADQFIKKVAPNLYKKVEYVGTESQGTYSGQYIYQFTRVENGIQMPDNTITVGVNFETGKVVTFNATWLYDVEIPSKEVKITEKEAIDIIGKNVTMKLAYQNAYTTDDKGNTTIKAFLVYYPDNSYIAVDAKTGKVYTTQNEWVEEYSRTTETAADEATKADAGGLSEEEILEVEELKNLISKDKAIEIITSNKSLLIDGNLKSISANLYKQRDYYSADEKVDYVWNIHLTDPREVNYDSKDTYRAYASARVDAKSGKILSFNASVKDYYNYSNDTWESVKVKYNKEQGQKVLETFLKDQIPDKFKNTVLTNNRESYVIAYKEDKEVYGGYYYGYDRVNEGINYSFNGIYGSVDGVTGKIYSFSYNWNDNVTFESPKNIISAKKAFDSYIANDGFQLAYEVNSIHKYDKSYETKEGYYDYSDAYSMKNEIRLVYRTDIYPNYISPFTGKQLDYNGNEYKKAENAFSYSDIKGHESEKNIRLLGDVGIGFEGGKFQPEKAITPAELKEFLSLVNFFYNTDKYNLNEKSSSITRIEVSKFMIQILGYEKIAKIKGIYSPDFKDKDKISEAYLGYASLAQGLGLVTVDDDKLFNPTGKLTRGDAADLLIALLSVE